MCQHLTLIGVALPEVAPGDDLGSLVAGATELADGDVVAVTSKIVSKSEGRVRRIDRPAAVTAESVRVLARRGDSVIAETAHGLVLAAAGVDASNTAPGTVLLLPADPDGSARRLRERLLALTGRNVAVVVTDTAGRAWRSGQTDLAIGCAGLLPLTDLRGTRDTFGNELLVTAPAIADELASAADLVKGKATGRPVAVLRGLAPAVLPPGTAGPGASALVRETALDLFGLGAREAALAVALRTDEVALRHLPPRTPPDPDPFAELTTTMPGVRVRVRRRRGGSRQQAGAATLGEPAGWDGWVVAIDVSTADAAADRATEAVGWATEAADRATEAVGRATEGWVPATEPDRADRLVEAGRLLERSCVLAAAYRLSLAEPAPRPRPARGWRNVAINWWLATSTYELPRRP
ncbi:MAG TPA: coenzyme F420-0:L-glutamate ligase [Nocardioidaceae bacterium]|nr:coenzyme F420-0:L-glutamate ligase [Nocardioidaceae bacterium]